MGAAAAAVSSSAAARGQLAGAVVISNEAIPQLGSQGIWRLIQCWSQDCAAMNHQE